MYKILIGMLILLTLSSCSYLQIRKPIIEQGNIITGEAVSKLHKGLSSAEVKDIMGTPVLVNVFTPDRMEYIYTYKERSNPLIIKRLIILFEEGNVVSIVRNGG